MSPLRAALVRSGSTRGIVGPDDRIYLGADLGLRATYRAGEHSIRSGGCITQLWGGPPNGSAWKRGHSWDFGWLDHSCADWERLGWNLIAGART